jgi:hypothetical protein
MIRGRKHTVEQSVVGAILMAARTCSFDGEGATKFSDRANPPHPSYMFFDCGRTSVRNSSALYNAPHAREGLDVGRGGHVLVCHRYAVWVLLVEFVQVAIIHLVLLAHIDELAQVLREEKV